MRRLKYNLLLILTLLILATATTAFAREVAVPKKSMKTSGNMFIDLCTAPNEGARESCGGVVASLINVQIEMGRIDPDQKFFCPQRVLSIVEARQIFLFWVEMKPEALMMEFPELVMEALRSRYPCNSTYTPLKHTF